MGGVGRGDNGAFLGCAIAEEGDEVGDEEGAGFGRDGCEG